MKIPSPSLIFLPAVQFSVHGFVSQAETHLHDEGKCDRKEADLCGIGRVGGNGEKSEGSGHLNRDERKVEFLRGSDTMLRRASESSTLPRWLGARPGDGPFGGLDRSSFEKGPCSTTRCGPVSCAFEQVYTRPLSPGERSAFVN